MWKSVASDVLTLLVVVLAVIGALIGWGKSRYNGEGPLEAAICLRVPAGSSFASVSDDLEAQGAVEAPG